MKMPWQKVKEAMKEPARTYVVLADSSTYLGSFDSEQKACEAAHVFMHEGGWREVEVIVDEINSLNDSTITVAVFGKNGCCKSPKGWQCSRSGNHLGPCALSPVSHG